MNYLIASPGRSGSIFVTQTIGQSLKRSTQYSHRLSADNLPQSFIYHTHDATLQLPDHDLTVIQPQRKDLFAEIVSALIAEHYNQWTEYTPEQTPFVADLDMCYDKYVWHKYWHKAFETLTRYQHRIYLTFEQFIGRSAVVCKALGIPSVDLVTQKSPHSVKNILNIEQVKSLFDKLENDRLLHARSVTDFDWQDHKTDTEQFHKG